MSSNLPERLKPAKILRVPATAWTVAVSEALTVSIWSGGMLTAMSMLPAISSATRVEASGTTRNFTFSNGTSIKPYSGFRSSATWLSFAHSISLYGPEATGLLRASSSDIAS